MAEKVNGSLFKMYLMDGTPTPAPKLISEQLSLSLNGSTNTIDVTSKDNAGWEEFIGGLQSGEITFEMIMDLSVDGTSAVNYTQMQAIKVGRQVRQYQAKLITPTKTLTRTFAALMTQYNVGSPMEDKITVSCTLRQSGAPTETTVATT